MTPLLGPVTMILLIELACDPVSIRKVFIGDVYRVASPLTSIPHSRWYQSMVDFLVPSGTPLGDIVMIVSTVVWVPPTSMMWQSPRGQIVWKVLIVIIYFIVPNLASLLLLSLVIIGMHIPW